MVVIRARLSPEDGAVVLAAIEAAGRDSDPAGADVSAQTPPPVAGGAAREGGPGDAGDVSAETWGGREVFYEGRPPVGVLVHVDQAVLADPGSGGCCHVEGVGAIAAHTARRLACDAAVATLLYRPDGGVEPTGGTRAVPASMRRAMLARDRHCRFPGCSTRRHLHAHHVVHWASGGPTALSNLVTLCGAHHRFVHEGGWRLSLTAGGFVTAHSPCGQTLTARPPAPPAPPPGALAARHRRHGLHLGADTVKYGGEPYDLDLAITVLQQATGRI